MPVIPPDIPPVDLTPFQQAELDLLRSILNELKMHRLILTSGFRAELNRQEITSEDVVTL